MQRRWCHFLAACPIASFGSWREGPRFFRLSGTIGLYDSHWREADSNSQFRLPKIFAEPVSSNPPSGPSIATGTVSGKATSGILIAALGARYAASSRGTACPEEAE